MPLPHLALALALCLATAQPPQESAEQFVARVYAPYLKGGGGWFVRAKEDNLRKVFTPALGLGAGGRFPGAHDRRKRSASTPGP